MPTVETITYPRVKPTIDNDPCLNMTMACEHVLDCGHVILTATPCEPCGVNCWNIRQAGTTKKKKSGPKFWCDACIEEEIEKDIVKLGVRAMEAEKRRNTVRERYARKNNILQKAARKCYIGAKNVSIPCSLEGAPTKSYLKDMEKLGSNHHPFDTAVPRIGNNMFEDIDTNPPKDPAPSSANIASVPSSTELDSPDHESEEREPRRIMRSLRSRKVIELDSSQTNNGGGKENTEPNPGHLMGRKLLYTASVSPPPRRILPPAVQSRVKSNKLDTGTKHVGKKRSYEESSADTQTQNLKSDPTVRSKFFQQQPLAGPHEPSRKRRRVEGDVGLVLPSQRITRSRAQASSTVSDENESLLSPVAVARHRATTKSGRRSKVVTQSAGRRKCI